MQKLSTTLLALAVLATGCSGDSGPGPSEPVRVRIVTEPSDPAASGAILTPAPVVELVDGSGSPVARGGVLVTAAIGSGSGSVSGRVSVRTDGAGRATFDSLAIAGPPGSSSLRFSAPGLASATSRTFQLVAGPPAELRIDAGNNQVAAVGTDVAIVPKVRVVDQTGNGVPGVTLVAELTGGGAIASGPLVTDAAGVASVGRWTMGTVPGPNTLVVRLGEDHEVTLSALAVVGPPAKLVGVDGDGQTEVVGFAVVVAPSVRITDAFDNPISGVTVTFAVGSGGGTVTGSPAISDENGVAAVGSWQLGSEGSNTLVASRAGVPPVTFTATGRPLTFRLISAGRFHACGLGPDGTAYCWGDNRFGQLGDSTFVDRPKPVRVKGGLVFDSLVSASNGHFTCGLTTAGETWCWGSNRHGQLGDGTNLGFGGPFGNSRFSPNKATGGPFVTLAAGGDHTCGLTADGTAYCWGRNFTGEVGDGTTNDVFQPTAVIGGQKFKTISAGESHTCGVAQDGAAWCWGRSLNGRLGVTGNQPPAVTAPMKVTGGHTFSAVSAGAISTCGLNLTGAILCWGGNSSGQLGDGTVTGRVAPAPVSGTNVFIEVSSGGLTACGRLGDGSLFCWGENDQGEAGSGAIGDLLVPTAIAAAQRFIRVSIAAEASCAVEQATGTGFCWGGNSDGQVGNGTTTQQLTPAPVQP